MKWSVQLVFQIKLMKNGLFLGAKHKLLQMNLYLKVDESNIDQISIKDPSSEQMCISPISAPK